VGLYLWKILVNLRRSAGPFDSFACSFAQGKLEAEPAAEILSAAKELASSHLCKTSVKPPKPPLFP